MTRHWEACDFTLTVSACGKSAICQRSFVALCLARSQIPLEQAWRWLAADLSWVFETILTCYDGVNPHSFSATFFMVQISDFLVTR